MFVNRIFPQNLTHKFIYSQLLFVTEGSEGVSAPLMEGEFSGASTDLILEEAWDKFRPQFDIRSSVTALFIVVRCRENSDNLG